MIYLFIYFLCTNISDKLLILCYCQLNALFRWSITLEIHFGSETVCKLLSTWLYYPNTSQLGYTKKVLNLTL